MLEVLLAGVLLALALGVYLLFRQLRKISWQLTLLRVEHDSERILHAMGVQTQGVRVPPEAPSGSGRLATARHLVRAHPTWTSAGAALAITAVLLATATAARGMDRPSPAPWPRQTVTPSGDETPTKSRTTAEGRRPIIASKCPTVAARLDDLGLLRPPSGSAAGT